MSSRYPLSPHIDSCLHPVRIVRNGREFYVPCGKCNGCLVSKSNEWSNRLGFDIQSNPRSIWATFTYNNWYVPKMSVVAGVGVDRSYRYFSAVDNVRFDGAKDVPRKDFTYFDSPYYMYLPLANYHNPYIIGYSSKRDWQLYIKLLRKHFKEYYPLYDYKFTYYAISEYGSGKHDGYGAFRPHIHAVFFPDSEACAEILLSALYSYWSMCDKTLFQQYTKYCSNGVRHYISSYVTGSNRLPSLLQTPEIAPFRLFSKGKTIGLGSLCRETVQKEIFGGITTYRTNVSQIGRRYEFRYSSNVIRSVFPKCKGYSLYDFDKLLSVYGLLYRLRRAGYDIKSLSRGLRALSPSDYTASLACLKYCDLYHISPVYYVIRLQEFYHRVAQESLKLFYQRINECSSPIEVFLYYQNILPNLELVLKRDSLDYLLPCISNLFYEYGIECHISSVGALRAFYNKLKMLADTTDYERELDDIVSHMNKNKKVNEVLGVSPHSY